MREFSEPAWTHAYYVHSVTYAGRWNASVFTSLHTHNTPNAQIIVSRFTIRDWFCLQLCTCVLVVQRNKEKCSSGQQEVSGWRSDIPEGHWLDGRIVVRRRHRRLRLDTHPDQIRRCLASLKHETQAHYTQTVKPKCPKRARKCETSRTDYLEPNEIWIAKLVAFKHSRYSSRGQWSGWTDLLSHRKSI